MNDIYTLGDHKISSGTIFVIPENDIHITDLRNHMTIYQYNNNSESFNMNDMKNIVENALKMNNKPYKFVDFEQLTKNQMEKKYNTLIPEDCLSNVDNCDRIYSNDKFNKYNTTVFNGDCIGFFKSQKEGDIYFIKRTKEISFVQAIGLAYPNDGIALLSSGQFWNTILKKNGLFYVDPNVTHNFGDFKIFENKLLKSNSVNVSNIIDELNNYVKSKYEINGFDVPEGFQTCIDRFRICYNKTIALEQINIRCCVTKNLKSFVVECGRKLRKTMCTCLLSVPICLILTGCVKNFKYFLKHKNV